MHANFHEPGVAAFPGEPPATPLLTTEPAKHAGRRIQITMSPYYGRPDFSQLLEGLPRPLDRVSVADLLRNGFVYPPHSVYEDVKVVTYEIGRAHV